MREKSSMPLSGRRAEAARNDERIWASARAVFAADPAAPISAVARRAGVGSGALYRRFPSKEALLRRLSLESHRRCVAVAEAALADEDDAWESFANFLREIVDAEVCALTEGLVGRFRPTEELSAAALRARDLCADLFERTKAAGVIRTDVNIDDVHCIFQQVASIRQGGEARTTELRHRYLAFHMDALRTLEVVTGGR